MFLNVDGLVHSPQVRLKYPDTVTPNLHPARKLDSWILGLLYRNTTLRKSSEPPGSGY